MKTLFIMMFELDLMSLRAIDQRVHYSLWKTFQNLKIPILLQCLKQLPFVHLIDVNLHGHD